MTSACLYDSRNLRPWVYRDKFLYSGGVQSLEPVKGLYSSSPADLFFPTPTRLIWEVLSNAAITVRKLFVQTYVHHCLWSCSYGEMCNCEGAFDFSLQYAAARRLSQWKTTSVSQIYAKFQGGSLTVLFLCATYVNVLLCNCECNFI